MWPGIPRATNSHSAPAPSGGVAQEDTIEELAVQVEYDAYLSKLVFGVHRQRFLHLAAVQSQRTVVKMAT